MATAQQLRIPITLEARPALAQFQVLQSKALETQRLAAEAGGALRDEIAGSVRVQAEGSKLAAELERRRLALVIRGISDEREKRSAQIALTSRMEQVAVDKLIQQRLQLGEIDERRAAELRQEFDRLGESARRVDLGRLGGGLGTVAGQGRNASEAIIQLSRGIEDLGYARNAGDAIRYAGNNVQAFTVALAHAKVEATAAGQSVAKNLVRSLAGPAGLSAAVALLTVGLPILVDKLRESEDGFEGSAGAAREARDAYMEAYEAAVALQFATTATLEMQGAASATRLRRSYARLAELQQQIRELEEEREGIVSRAGGPRNISRNGPEARRIQEILGEIADLTRQTEKFEGVARDAADNLDRVRAELDAIGDLGSIGESTDVVGQAEEDAAKAAERAAQRAQRLTETEARRAAREAERRAEERAELVRRLSIESIESEREREIAAVRETERERLAVVRGNAEAEAQVRAIADRQVLEINLRHQEQAYQAALQYREAEFEIAMQAAELAGATEAQRFEDRLANLDAERETAREMFGEESDQYRALDHERRSLYLEYLQFQDDERAEREKKELELQGRIAKAREENLDRAEQAYQRELRSVERQVNRVLDVFADAALFRRELADAEIEATVAQYDREERELEESLRRRQISEEEFADEMKALTAERAEFEKEAEADRASFVARSIVGLKALAIEAGAEALQAFVAQKAIEVLTVEGAEGAKTLVTVAGAAERIAALGAEGAAALANAGKTMVGAVAKLVDRLVATLGPFAIAAVPVAAAGLYGAYRGARALFLASGGPVSGPGGPTDDRVPAMLSNGEHVLTAAEVVALGGHDGVERLRQLAIAGLLPRFAEGGRVVARPALPGARPIAVAPAAAALAGERVDLGPLVGEVRQLRAEVRAFARTNERLAAETAGAKRITGRDARAIQRAAEQERRSRTGS